VIDVKELRDHIDLPGVGLFDCAHRAATTMGSASTSGRARRYKQLKSDDPDLAKILSPACAHELREWHDGGQLYAIRVHDETVGVLAIGPSSVGWIDGDEVSEGGDRHGQERTWVRRRPERLGRADRH
jgi:hypothetical protein